MRTRTLGTQGLVVSAQGLGCMGMSVAYGPAEESASIAAIHTALDLGVLMLDTADMYGPHRNEELIAAALGDRRRDVVLASKFGNEIDDDGNLTWRINGRPEYVRKSIDGTLRRLGTDYLDLYYQHRVDPDVPVEETFGAMSELVAAGKVRYLGISEASAETLRRAHAVHPLTAIQTEYSLFTRDVEDNGVLATARELGIGFVAYSPLGRGFLSGTIRSIDDLAADDFRRVSPRFQGENFAKNLAVVDKLRELAESKGVTPAQLALSWVLSRGEDIVAIPGTTKPEHVVQNVAVEQIVLEPAELAAIEAVAPTGIAAGERYPAPAMAQLGR
ncbi:aldo/keto reductase [Nocardia cyriacigeorgica]|uniref:Putative oxidoreductase n=1 Tax=Nocardia cyriacigeorgica TaxID=135487 RepID=A0A4V6ICB7_9NOCA|nr:aldo/keto reductase [Nocardia cyriacigeorgica]MBF6101681.1 aldo/keto reductase [Nocardia cyriacigeorgica]MBF6158940.1 aldo/keto reductase [Nocardia cyriacigeorgica]MBF6197374.1 aldo/keto reductase [Nocardia cyriacigeorgica]MBF6319048.1 aldo/keto reductase [Nocardia cyriacigeorgica]MBF6344366.1 aldo/keto reductase [Nocardia cyriacigeorgica]